MALHTCKVFFLSDQIQGLFKIKSFGVLLLCDVVTISDIEYHRLSITRGSSRQQTEINIYKMWYIDI